MVKWSKFILLTRLMTAKKKERHCFYGITEESIEIVKIYAVKKRITDGKAIDEIIKEWYKQISQKNEDIQNQVEDY